jgi:ribosomal protein S18 acetylase RimI-like enzyme
MVHALGVLAGIGRTLACAVDMDNAPALRLYEQQGFRRFAARDAFILPLHRAAK